MNNEALKWVLTTEHNIKDRSGLYGYTQRTMAYNSNRIEGSTLTEDQTAALFEEGYLPATDEYYKSKDIEEMNGHFLMFNKMISYFGQPLSEEMIKQFHYELKAGVFEDRANGYAIGEYKKRTNTVGGLTVSAPDMVGEKMNELLEWYRSQSFVDLGTLAELHARYELIHPFQDGNGRTGRIILYKECIEHDIMPFIIHNENRTEYVISLKEAQTGGSFLNLAKYFEREQKDYAARCEQFDIYSRYDFFLNSMSTQNEETVMV
jgi:Fic family protein